MLNSLLDFGALDPKLEKLYISSILADLKIPNQNMRHKFVDIINICQEFIRIDVENNRSSVSLRDIQRVKEITEFYALLYLFKRKIKNMERFRNNSKHDTACRVEKSFDEFVLTREKGLDSPEVTPFLIDAFTVSIYLNYVYRIFNIGKSL